MRAYFIRGYKASLAASSTLMTLEQPATALKRISVQYWQFSSPATADNAYEAWIQRITALGASPGTSVTPQLRDPADGAASATSYFAPTNEPTYTASAYEVAFSGHQRATNQWYAAPGHDIIIPVTNNAGLGVFLNAATASFNASTYIEFEE